MCSTVQTDSYLTSASQSAGSVAKQAVDRESRKQAELSATYEFQPVAVESHVTMDDATGSFSY